MCLNALNFVCILQYDHDCKITGLTLQFKIKTRLGTFHSLKSNISWSKSLNFISDFFFSFLCWGLRSWVFLGHTVTYHYFYPVLIDASSHILKMYTYAISKIPRGAKWTNLVTNQPPHSYLQTYKHYDGVSLVNLYHSIWGCVLVCRFCIVM